MLIELGKVSVETKQPGAPVVFDNIQPPLGLRKT